MKLVGGILIGMAAGWFTAWRVHARPSDLLQAFLKTVVVAATLGMFSLLLPEELASMAEDFLAWGLAGTVAAFAVLAGVKGLESLLDA
ncbi:MAG: hypothetical protein ABIP46_07785 [Polaromonas sp.]